MLRINQVVKLFHNKPILNYVSLAVERGQIAVLLGQSGVGKSTLLRILNNLDPIDAGTITLDNIALDPITLTQKHLVGMVFQHFNLFEHMTVEQNITLALEKVLHKKPAEAKNIAHELLHHYQLFEKKDTYPSGLSGGQKQRLALARTLALKPSIICLDEPTSALDPVLTSHVARSIQELAHEKYMVLVATHDTTLLEKLDCTIHLMQQGNIIEAAPSKEFYRNKDNYPHIARFIAGIAQEL